MNTLKHSALSLLAAALGLSGISCAHAEKPVLNLLVPGKPAQTAPVKPAYPHPFIQSAYLWTQGTDTDLSGDGDWGMYKKWLNLPALGAESDPGGWDNWGSTCEGWNNQHWGEQQTRYGIKVLPEILLGIGTMPYDPTPGHSWDQKLAWAGQQWQKEADNDPETMQHFVALGTHIAEWHYKSVIVRMDYEFDGGWDPYGNLHGMPNMPANFIKAWQNVVTTVRKTVHDKDPSISVKFLWNPTDANVQITSADYYPGDGFVDYIGFDNYDFEYNGDYKSGVQPDAATSQKAWDSVIGKRAQWFAEFASAANSAKRPGGVAGRSVPLIVGEWGLWQVEPNGRPAGGDDPTYIQNMYDWMCKHNVYMECYFETPSDGRSTLWPGGYPVGTAANPSWGKGGTPYPKSAALYRTLFGNPIPPVMPSVPAGVTALPGFKYTNLNWSPSAGEPAPTYTVTRGTARDRLTRPVAEGLIGTSFHDTGLLNGRTYYYAVQAKSSTGASAPSAAVSVIPAIPANYVQNGGFESGSLDPWQTGAGSTSGAAYLENADNRIHVHSGGRQYTHWANAPYETGVFQDIAVTNGPHTVSAWLKCSGGQAVCQMSVKGYHGADQAVVPIPAAPAWTQFSATVNVTTGTLTVGFHSKAAANQWINIDDVVVK